MQVVRILKQSFNAQLFLDSNSDGKFSTTNEGIAANKIKLYCDGTIVNPVWVMMVNICIV